MKKICFLFSVLMLVLATTGLGAEGMTVQEKKSVDTKTTPVQGKTQANPVLQEKPYIIGASDLLDISVWGEQALSRQVSVRTDGYISLPLVGDITAVGKTPSQLQKNIEISLTKFIKDPRCAVIVIEPRSKRFYVEGQVNHPGFFLLDRDLNLTQAISLAGGFAQWADKGNIVILRSEDGKQRRITADYGRIMRGKDTNILIQPGDTIIVP